MYLSIYLIYLSLYIYIYIYLYIQFLKAVGSFSHRQGQAEQHTENIAPRSPGVQVPKPHGHTIGASRSSITVMYQIGAYRKIGKVILQCS